MARQRKEKPRLSGWIERLEDRRVMSADPLFDAPSLELHDADQPPALEQHVLGDPDFWIDTSLQTGLDDYLDQVDRMLTEAHNLTGWFNVRSNYGFSGLGQTVAIIDSGIAYNHFALGGGLGANYRVVGGWDFTEENDANPIDDPGSGSHGSHVSGIVGSSDANHTGVAPGVDLVALRVFNDAGQGFFTWVENALRWVINNRTTFENPITAINLSLGVSSWNYETIPGWANLEDEFQQLEAAGIFIAVSAGNSFNASDTDDGDPTTPEFYTPGLSYPASSPFVVPVMSTNDAGQMSSFSQRLNRAIAAPGQNIVSTVPVYDANGNITGHTFAAKGGTSMAAPYVAGASVLIRQAMQFVGMTNITQDMIYNHMMATADTFFDAATNQNYQRLNLARAIDNLMPADDYGSTAAAAFNMGTMTGPMARNGQIARLSDVDCFRFTASATGTVTFSATVSPGMTRTWQVWGATAGSSAPGTLAFNVVAGQTYTIGLSSPTGLGSYSLSSTFLTSTPQSYLTWGTIAFNEFNNISVAGEQWYRVDATRSGFLTAIGSFNLAGGGVSLSLADANFQIIANGSTSGGQARLDANVAGGGVYYVRVTGTNADIDFKLANLVSQSGASVSVAGTGGNDAYAFSAAAFNVVTVNGVSYSFAAAAATQFNLQGGAGTDSLVLSGGAGAETFTLGAGTAAVVGSGYALAATDFENQTATSGGGADVANLYDSAGNDGLQLHAFYANFTYAGGGSSIASGFSQVVANSTAGFDYVDFYDSAANDTASLWSDRVRMTAANYANEVRGFDLVAAHAWRGGYDVANYYDSAGNDAYSAWADHAAMTGAGYDNRADGFDQTIAVAGAGGTDVATLYDSAGNDGLAMATRYARFGYAGGASATASGFGQIIAHSAAGFDYADLYDSTGSDTASLWSDRATMVGAGYTNDARGFDLIAAHSRNGGADAANLYDSAGNDGLQMWSRKAIYSYAGGAKTIALGFGQVVANSAAGWDYVDLYDTAGNDTVSLWAGRTMMSGNGFANDARGFDLVAAHAWFGGVDRANFYDSAGSDLYSGWSNRAAMSGAGFDNRADSFEQYSATSGAGGTDRADLHGSAGVDRLSGASFWVAYRGSGYQHDIYSFDQVCGRGLLTNDVIDLGATDYVFSQLGA